MVRPSVEGIECVTGGNGVDKREVFVALIGNFFKKLGMAPGEETLEKLQLYTYELWRWNKAYNLISRKLDQEGLFELVLDSLTPLSINGLFRPEMKVLDVGAGAGMPGIPLFICSGGFILELVEPVRKKVTFMRHVVRVLSLNKVTVTAERLESLSRKRGIYSGRYDLVMSRAAMAPVAFLRNSITFLKEGGRALVFVGPGDASEIRKESIKWAQKGLQIQEIKSVARVTGKDKYLVLAKKV